MKRYHHLLAQCLAASGALIWAWSTGLPTFHHDDLLITDSALAQDSNVGNSANQPKNGASDSSIDHLISNIIGNNAAPPARANNRNGDGNVDEIISRMLGENAEHQEAEKITGEKAVAPEKTFGRDEAIDRVISSATEHQKAYIESQKKKKIRAATPDKKSRALAAAPKATKRPATHDDHGANSQPAPTKAIPAQPPLAKPAPPKPAQPELAQAKPAPTQTTQTHSEQTKVRERAGDSGNAFEQESQGKNEGQSTGSGPAGFDVASGANSSGETPNAFGEAAKMGANRSAEAAGEPRAAGDAGEGQLAHYVPEWLRGMPGSYAFVSLFGICVIIALLAGAIHSRREEVD